MHDILKIHSFSDIMPTGIPYPKTKCTLPNWCVCVDNFYWYQFNQAFNYRYNWLSSEIIFLLLYSNFSSRFDFHWQLICFLARNYQFHDNNIPFKFSTRGTFTNSICFSSILWGRGVSILANILFPWNHLIINGLKYLDTL